MWSPQQEAALERVGRWIKSKDRPYFSVGGFAGTGKTTLAKHLASTVSGMTYFAALTGKAAHVLRKSGAPNVSTIHKLIYKPKDKSQQKLKELLAEKAHLITLDPLPTRLIAECQKAIESEQANLSRPMFAINDESPLKGAALLVVDEYSMVDSAMGEDIMSFGVPVLFLGDPGQLPPIRGNPFLHGGPDIMLTEIHRQARDNPIIWMSAEIREGRALAPGSYGSSRVISYGDLPREQLASMILSTDQLLVGRNATRLSSNMRVRELLQRTSALPQQGDRLVCLRNNHDLGLLNGQIWNTRVDSIFDDKYVILDLENEDKQRVEVCAHQDYFRGGEPAHWDIKDAECFDYGHALTVHKAQGSQWDHLVLLDEWYGRDRRQWLYTAVTRAAQSINIVQM